MYVHLSRQPAVEDRPKRVPLDVVRVAFDARDLAWVRAKDLRLGFGPGLGLG